MKKYITVLDYITFKGHNIASVEWMEHQIDSVITN